MGTWIKRREVVDGTRRTRSEKLREQQYREEYARAPDGEYNEMEKTMSSTFGGT